jgi:hypothetical protein
MAMRLEMTARPLYRHWHRVGLLSVASRSAKKRFHDDLFNHLVGRGKNLRRQLEAKRFRSFESDHQFDLRYSHYRQISGFAPFRSRPP